MSIIDLDSVILLDEVISKIALLLFFLVVLKFISRRLAKTSRPAFKKVDRAFMKIHLPIGFAMIALAIVHGVCSLYSVESLGWMPFFIGVICIAACLTAVISYYMRKSLKKQRNWLAIHQISTVIACITLVGHIILAKNPGIFGV